ncbi:MAG: PAS domain S-box protein [Deltaproteobacteria bacterium]|nr:PAS domain S-box protein [Deltaproteobacteria bacterium]
MSRPSAPLPGLVAPLDLEVFRRMADMSNEAFFLTDAAAHLRYVNERALTLTGYAREQLLAMTLFDLEPELPRSRLFAMLDAAVRGPMPPFEARTLRRDGASIPTEVSLARIDVGGDAYLFGVVRDISERKRIEAVQRSFARRMLENLEAERQRVARELHDDVGQAVATVGVLLHTLAQTPGAVADGMRPALSTTLATIGGMTESVARLCREYHPAELLGLGLEDGLRAYVREFARRHGLAARVSTPPLAEPLDDERELHLYRIAQEALANVARHARAREVAVRLARRGSRLLLTIHDDGIGFTPAGTEGGARGLGLATMRERAEIMGAAFAIRSRPRRGTEVRVVVPIAPARGIGVATRAAAT